MRVIRANRARAPSAVRARKHTHVLSLLRTVLLAVCTHATVCTVVTRAPARTRALATHLRFPRLRCTGGIDIRWVAAVQFVAALPLSSCGKNLPSPSMRTAPSEHALNYVNYAHACILSKATPPHRPVPRAACAPYSFLHEGARARRAHCSRPQRAQPLLATRPRPVRGAARSFGPRWLRGPPVPRAGARRRRRNLRAQERRLVNGFQRASTRIRGTPTTLLACLAVQRYYLGKLSCPSSRRRLSLARAAPPQPSARPAHTPFN